MEDTGQGGISLPTPVSGGVSSESSLGSRDGIWEHLEQEGDCKGAKSDAWGVIREESRESELPHGPWWGLQSPMAGSAQLWGDLSRDLRVVVQIPS